MPQGRHSLAPRASKPRRLAFIAAPLITCGLVGVGVATTNLGSSLASDKVDFTSSSLGASADLGNRTTSLSRSADRATGASVVAAASTVPEIKDRLWTTSALDLRLNPADKAAIDGEFASLRKIGVTGVRRNGFAEVVVAGETRWVSAAYLVAEKPTDSAHLSLVDRPCAGTSGVENGITPRAVRVYRAVCNNFPQITRYGGYSPHGEHSSGRALDIMTSDLALGNAIADFLRAHASELDLFDVIWQQHIWTPVRAGEGWRAMPDRGSPTANHYDHVHVSVN